MQTLRFHSNGPFADVLKLEHAPIPVPPAHRIRIKVRACALNPADGALCMGLFPGPLPRGVGLDVSGIVDALGEGVTNVSVGDAVLGSVDYRKENTAGAAEYAIMDHWHPLPPNLGHIDAAALTLTLSTETALRSFELLHMVSGQTLFVNGAGTTVGYATAQIALLSGLKVIATSGEAYAEKLRGLGVRVTQYGEGLPERVQQLVGEGDKIDMVLDAAPVSGALPDLIKLVDHTPRKVFTVSDFAAAKALGARSSFDEEIVWRYDAVGEYANLAAEGKYSIPISKSLPLDKWKDAMELCCSQAARGKVIILPSSASAEIPSTL